HTRLPAKSQLYAALPRLVAARLVRRRTVRQSGRPDKHVYRLTARGRRSVEVWLERAPPRTWDELLLKVFFAGLGSRDALLRQLEEQREVQLAQLEEYRAIERNIATNPSTRYGYLTL